MSQQSVVTEYFATRKRRASEDLRNKSKVLILDGNETQPQKVLPIIREDETKQTSMASLQNKLEPKRGSVVRNLKFDADEKTTTKSATPRARTPRTRRSSVTEDKSQTDIREALLKQTQESDNKNVLFAKLGNLSPKKTRLRTTRALKKALQEEEEEEEVTKIDEPVICKTPTKAKPLVQMNIDEIKTKLNKSSRLAELRERINKLKSSSATPSTTPHLNSSIIDTPPATPRTPATTNSALLKGIPTSLLEKIRAKQAAKDLERMTRTSTWTKTR
ncbi:unnamed protein product [Trichogramma brassicae]|uniref:Uncharacterized protein n=1 Tax=Trichogramma brassicae TaxID=86971 RepID=A0A6H5HVI4_9HYME|nr:unnamed protein product [Trichogramma brassicae]